jgi:hypothetical protein
MAYPEALSAGYCVSTVSCRRIAPSWFRHSAAVTLASGFPCAQERNTWPDLDIYGSRNGYDASTDFGMLFCTARRSELVAFSCSEDMRQSDYVKGRW